VYVEVHVISHVEQARFGTE